MSYGTIDADLRAAAASSPRQEAIVADDGRLTYEELDRRAGAFAAGLAALDVRRGERVAIALRNDSSTAVALYGTLRAGAAFTIINPASKPGRLARLLSHSGASIAVGHSDLAESMLQAARDAGCVRHVVSVGDELEGAVSFASMTAHEPAEPAPVVPVDLAAIIYTSGSTGEPKGAVFLHRNMTFVADSIIEYLALKSDERILCVLPLSHTYGLYHLIMSVRCGATLVLQQGMAFPQRAVDALEAERITMMPGIPTTWQMLLSLNDVRERELPHLRTITNAGAALSVTQINALRDLFPSARLFSMYGQTECKRVCYLAPEQLDARPGSVGRAIPGTELRIVGEDGEDVADGEVGELLVRGDHVMQGYWNDPVGTAAKLIEGRWPGDRVLRSGDLFRRDADGYLYFVARTDDIIKSRGEKVAPKEIEEVLHMAEGVRDAAVVGVPDERLGEALVAHVSAMSGQALDESALRRHCAAHLEAHLVPQAIKVHTRLPTTDNGKLDRRALRLLGR